ncbi:tRNA pseudouridine(38-40) synthase TruA [Crocinitomicaceae bacterium]|nr:tRNA pseudouridine(38-40) synthase TruA [Crocinitomicaceae bacterium]
MKRYFIELSFNGRDFFGWQRQPNDRSIQEEIETALSKIHSNQNIKVVGCGRTDTGVHAKHFILHVDLPEIDVINKLKFKLNRMLPESIAIQRIYEVGMKMHARFNALKRTYRYFIHDHKNPFNNQLSWHVQHKLNIDAMNQAAELLLGTKDFTSFSKLHTDVKTNICTVSHAMWRQNEDGLYFEICADRFLRNMVRAIVGTLIDVGIGKIEINSIDQILETKNRSAASTSVPPHGLFLWKVTYQNDPA